MSAESIKANDIVYLKSGGHAMVVKVVGPISAHCMWSTEAKTIAYEWLPISALTTTVKHDKRIGEQSDHYDALVSATRELLAHASDLDDYEHDGQRRKSDAFAASLERTHDALAIVDTEKKRGQN